MMNSAPHALTCIVLAGLATNATAAAHPQPAGPQEPVGEQQRDPGESQMTVAELTQMQRVSEALLGFDVYLPEHTDNRRLMGTAAELTSRKVSVAVEAPDGSWHFDSRDRMIRFGDAIGIQDFEQGRKELLTLLQTLDARYGEVHSAGRGTSQDSGTAVRLSNLSVFAGAELVSSLLPELAPQPLPDSGLLVLRGTQEKISEAQALLAEIDRPAPQFTLDCMLIQACEEAAAEPLPEGLASGLSQLVPAAHFRPLGHLITRGSVAANSSLSVRTSLPELSDDPSVPGRFSLQARPRAYDRDHGRLTLEGCEVKIERPVFQRTAALDGEVQSNFSGYSTTEEIETQLVLRADEMTVVGALGESPLYVVMRFTAHSD